MSMSGAKALSRTENGLAGSDFMIACFSRSGSLRHRAGVSAVGIPRPKAGEDVNIAHSDAELMCINWDVRMDAIDNIILVYELSENTNIMIVC